MNVVNGLYYRYRFTPNSLSQHRFRYTDNDIDGVRTQRKRSIWRCPSPLSPSGSEITNTNPQLLEYLQLEYLLVWDDNVSDTYVFIAYIIVTTTLLTRHALNRKWTQCIMKIFVIISTNLPLHGLFGPLSLSLLFIISKVRHVKFFSPLNTYD